MAVTELFDGLGKRGDDGMVATEARSLGTTEQAISDLEKRINLLKDGRSVLVAQLAQTDL
jgi:hypothetical protein